MLGRFPNIQLNKFPRMTTADTIIWRRFLEQHAANYERFDYDLPVGLGEDPGPSVSEPYRQDFIDLTKKRIDAVGYSGNMVTLFEVKPRAGTTALGQLLTYKDLYIKSFPNTTPPTLAVVTEFMNTDEQSIYESHNIEIFIL